MTVQYIKDCTSAGGKVLLPVSSLNVTDFTSLLERCVDESIPIFIGNDLAGEAVHLRKRFSDWMRDDHDHDHVKNSDLVAGDGGSNRVLTWTASCLNKSGTDTFTLSVFIHCSYYHPRPLHPARAT